MNDIRRNENEENLELKGLLDYTPPPPDEDLVARIMEKVRMEAHADTIKSGFETRSYHTLHRKTVLIAASLLIAMAVVVLWALRPATVQGSLRATEKTVVDLGKRANATVGAWTRIDYTIRPAFLFWDAEAVITQGIGDVRYRVQRGGPFIVTTPSSRVRVTGTDFKVEVFEMKSKTRGALIGAGVSIATVVTVYAGSVVLENEGGDVAIAAGQSARAESGAAPEQDSTVQKNQPVTENQKEQTPQEIHRFENKKKREQLIRVLHAARRLRLMKENNDGETPKMIIPEDIPDGAAMVLGPLPKEMVRDAVHAVIDDVRACFEKQLQLNPKLEGKLRLDFSVTSEQGVGGVVENVEINDKSDDVLESNADLSECIIDTIYTLEFPDARGSGTTTVSYPLLLGAPPTATPTP